MIFEGVITAVSCYGDRIIRPTSADSTDPRFARKNVLLKEQKKRVTFL